MTNVQSELEPLAMGDGVSMRPLGETLGLEVTGCDLSRDASQATAAITQLFLKHRVLVFRQQQITNQQLQDFAAHFGSFPQHVFRQPDGSVFPTVHIISNLDAAGKPSPNPYLAANLHWHTDHAFKARPALLTMLYAVEIPPEGGDTDFANATLAYRALPQGTKDRIAGLQVEHSYEYMRTAIGTRPASAAEIADTPPVVHPLVRTHPQTGEKSLYLGMYSSRILGMSEPQSRQLLDELTAHATQPQFVYRHVWQLHDMVMWDNRCLLHRAVPNYDATKHRRVMRRAVIQGEVPV